MTIPTDSIPKTAPRIQKKKAPTPKKLGMGGVVGIVTMLVSLAAISIALAGGAKLIFDVLLKDDENKNFDNVLVKVAVLAFSFIFGWATGLVSIRGFGNKLYPIIIRMYALGLLAATSILYLEIIVRLFKQEYSGQKFGIYLVVMLGVLFVLFCLHLLVEKHVLRPFAIPLLILSVIHLFMIMLRFLFTEDAKGIYALGDFTFFILMVDISGLMLLNVGMFSPVRDQISGLFSTKVEEKNESINENGVR